MAKKKLLIVSYTFPPAKGIGGKRWSKFAKYLSKCGYEVHVICHKRPFTSESVEMDNVIVHEFHAFYPAILSKNPSTLVEKLKYRFWVSTLPLLTKGSIYDKTIFARSAYLKIANELIEKHSIKSMIVTCAPFNLAHYSLELKDRHDLSLTVDLRDPWTWGKGYGYSIMSKSRLNHDKNIEKNVIEKVDFVCSPSEEILNHLKEEYQLGDQNRLVQVPHGIDSESFPLSRQEFKSKVRQSSLKIVYAGTLYEGYSFFLNKLIDSVKALQPATYDRFKFDLYSTTDFQQLNANVEQNQLSNKIVFHAAIKEEVLLSKYPTYDFTLLFFPEKFKDFITTKIYELVYANLPIIYIGFPGKLSEFVTKNSLGIFINYDQMENTFADAIEKLASSEFNTEFEVENFTFDKVTKRMIEKLGI